MATMMTRAVMNDQPDDEEEEFRTRSCPHHAPVRW
jgi:hypothetical protein